MESLLRPRTVHMALLSLHLLLQSLSKLGLPLPLQFLRNIGIDREPGRDQPAASCPSKSLLLLILLLLK
jgi:hypothetical protein